VLTVVPDTVTEMFACPVDVDGDSVAVYVPFPLSVTLVDSGGALTLTLRPGPESLEKLSRGVNCNVTLLSPIKTRSSLSVKVEFASVSGPALTVTAVAVDSGMTIPPGTTTLPAARRGCTVPDEHSVTTIDKDSPAAALLADGENTHPVAMPTLLMSLAVSPEIA
jgi:hypothetical protein